MHHCVIVAKQGIYAAIASSQTQTSPQTGLAFPIIFMVAKAPLK